MKVAIKLLLILMLTSCKANKQNIYNDLLGNWEINKIEYEGVDYKNHILSMNVININKDNRLSTPEIDVFTKDKYAFWDFDYSNDIITFVIKSENKILDGRYYAQMIKLESIDKLILQSESSYLELHKF